MRGFPAFKDELAAIRDEKVRAFSGWILGDVARKWFWSAPASMTAKYHPPWANEEGGLVLHTKVVVFLARELCRSWGIGGLLLDQVTAAAIIHDVVKWGERGPGKEGYEVYKRHDVLLTEVVERELRRARRLDSLDSRLRKVLSISETHLGRWSFCPRPMKKTSQRILHVADYVSSRREISKIDLPPTLPEEPW